MFQDKFIFPQLTASLDRNHFNHLVRKYGGDKYVKYLTCWSQLLALMFGRLSKCESLRDLIVAQEAHQSKCFHLGLGRKTIAKTTLATANQNRNYRIFEEFAFYMMAQAKERRVTDIFKFEARCMHSTLQQYRSACQCSGGQSSARRKVVSRLTSSMIWRHRCQPSIISPRLPSTIPR